MGALAGAARGRLDGRGVGQAEGCRLTAGPPRDHQLAVALHGVEPATFEHCALIRDWLGDLGVGRVTLLVIPAADHHPFYQRSPALVHWLRERRDEGDAVAQQGFLHPRVAAPPRDAVDHVRAGRRLMERAGVAPSGFCAPSLRHALRARRELISSFDWWLAPGLWRAGAALHRSETLRVDLHPAAFAGRAGRTRALERTLRAEAGRRDPVTFDDLRRRLPGEAARVVRG